MCDQATSNAAIPRNDWIEISVGDSRLGFESIIKPAPQDRHSMLNVYVTIARPTASIAETSRVFRSKGRTSAWSFVAVHESGFGTSATSSDVRFRAASGGRADIRQWPLED